MTTNDYTLLYVEDDTDFAELNIQWFTRQGYRVIYAPSGDEAIRAFEKSDPDIVLLDVMLPDMLGFEVCGQIREIDQSVPVIFLTSLSDSLNAVKGLELGAYDYIRKDASLEEIEVRIKSVLTRTGGHHSKIRITEESYIDNLQRTIVVCGETHKAGQRIIKLLHLLLQQKNQLCKRDDLVTRIWGNDCINGDVYLNQSIATLRRILSADKRLSIKSFRNAGIILTDES